MVSRDQLSINWIKYDWRCLLKMLDQYEIREFKRPGLEGKEAVRMTGNFFLQCIEAGCTAFPRSS